jgi:tetratricopeptide (TPR) repeat protein
MSRKTHIDRRVAVWLIILVALACALCALPLFDLLGFEFAFAIGVVAAVAGAHLGVHAAWRTRAAQSRSDGERADARPLVEVARLWWRAAGTVWALLLAPLAIVTANALRVRNCNYAAGLEWYALLALPSSACGAAAGVVCGILPLRRRGFATLAAIGVLIASLLWSLERFYAAPPIFAYDPFGGYFPGTLYDEEVAIGAPLFWARLYHVACAACALALAALFLDGAALRLRLRAARDRAGTALVALALAACALTLYARAPKLGFRQDANDIARALGAEKRTPHFVLHYSPQGPFAKDIELYAADHEQRFRELAALFGVAPKVAIHSFLFDSTAQKQALTGAARTSIAKPWRHEIYLQNDGWPHPVVKHELAHVFAGEFGDPWFGVSRRDLRVNVGLVEGAATAAAWASNPLTPHQEVKSMLLRGHAPDLASLLSYAFFASSGHYAYTASGSFCRFLLDTRGAAPFERVYRAGGSRASFVEAYGAPLEKLQAEWLAFIDEHVTISDEQRAVAEVRVSAPSVFQKVCAHELALKRDAAHRAAAGGDFTRALAELEDVCRAEPRARNLVELMDTAAGAGRYTDALRAADQLLLKTPSALASERAHAELVTGDAMLAAGLVRSSARAHYQRAIELGLDEADRRLATVKTIACDEPPGAIADQLIHFLVQPAQARDAALDLLALGRLTAAAPERGLFHYLIGRQLAARNQHDEAARELELGLERGLPDDRFRREAQRLRGIALYRAGRVADARAVFTQILDGAPPEGARLEALDWIARCSG